MLYCGSNRRTFYSGVRDSSEVISGQPYFAILKIPEEPLLIWRQSSTNLTKEFIMEIIAKTKDGVMISATSKEAKEILRSVTGEDVEDLNIGQKIPALDYAGSLVKVRQLKENYEFKMVCQRVESFKEEFDNLVESINKAATIWNQ